MRTPEYENSEQRQNAYDEQREDRWSLEEALLVPVADLICRIITGYGSKSDYEKYAERLISEFIETHPGVDIPGYLRGVPDLKLIVNGIPYYVEIKIKRSRYRNTIRGSRTVNAYGCASQYLDIVPVYENLLAFSDHFSINKESIILLYCVNPKANKNMKLPLNPSDWVFEGIDLKTLKMNIDANRYQQYGQGYGHTTWLVRCDDLISLKDLFNLP